MLVFGVTPWSACAHNPDMDWKQVGDRLEVEAFFDDDMPARAARVQILDDQKNVVATAITDGAGKCVLRTPNPGKYQLVLDAGAGHRKQRTITIVGTLPVSDSESRSKADPVPSSTRREELTRFPWERVALGLGVIALVGGAWRWSRRRPKTSAVV